MTPPPTTATSACGSWVLTRHRAYRAATRRGTTDGRSGHKSSLDAALAHFAADVPPGAPARAAVGRAPVPDLRRHARRAPAGVRARARAARRRRRLPAALQGRDRRGDPRRGGRRARVVRGRGRAVHPQRPARPGGRRRAPTASTSARTTCRSPRPARSPAPTRSSASPPTAPSRSTRGAGAPTTSASARSTRRRPSPAAPPSAPSSSPTRRATPRCRGSRSAAWTRRRSTR